MYYLSLGWIISAWFYPCVSYTFGSRISPLGNANYRLGYLSSALMTRASVLENTFFFSKLICIETHNNLNETAVHGLNATVTSEFVDFLQRLGRISRSFLNHCSNCESKVRFEWTTCLQGWIIRVEFLSLCVIHLWQQNL